MKIKLGSLRVAFRAAVPVIMCDTCQTIKVKKAFSKDMQDRWMQISVETIECKLCSGEEDNRGRGSTKDEPWLRCTGNGCSNEIEDVKRPESHFLEADIAHNAHLGKGDDLKCARSEIQEHLSNFIKTRSEMRFFLFAKIVVLKIVVFRFFDFFERPRKIGNFIFC